MVSPKVRLVIFYPTKSDIVKRSPPGFFRTHSHLITLFYAHTSPTSLCFSATTSFVQLTGGYSDPPCTPTNRLNTLPLWPLLSLCRSFIVFYCLLFGVDAPSVTTQVTSHPRGVPKSSLGDLLSHEGRHCQTVSPPVFSNALTLDHPLLRTLEPNSALLFGHHFLCAAYWWIL